MDYSDVVTQAPRITTPRYKHSDWLTIILPLLSHIISLLIIQLITEVWGGEAQTQRYQNHWYRGGENLVKTRENLTHHSWWNFEGRCKYKYLGKFKDCNTCNNKKIFKCYFVLRRYEYWQFLVSQMPEKKIIKYLPFHKFRDFVGNFIITDNDLVQMPVYHKYLWSSLSWRVAISAKNLEDHSDKKVFSECCCSDLMV